LPEAVPLPPMTPREQLATELTENLEMLDVLKMSKADKLELAQRLNDQRKELLGELGVAVDDDSPRAAARKKIARRRVPWLTNLSEDGQQSGRLVFYLRPGLTRVGRDTPARARMAPSSDVATPRGSPDVATADAGDSAQQGDGSEDEPRYIVLHSRAIRPLHARLRSLAQLDGSHAITIFAEPGGAVFVNGAFLSPSASEGVLLRHNDRVVLGSHHIFVFQEPSMPTKGKVGEAESEGGTSKDPATLGSTWQDAIRELEEHGSVEAKALMFQAYAADELGSVVDAASGAELFSASGAFELLYRADVAALGLAAAALNQQLSRLLKLALVGISALVALAELWAALGAAASLFDIVLALEMAALSALLIGGVLSLRPLLVPIPTLSRSSTLVFLESLTGAFIASRATDSYGRLLGSSLFALSALHAAWLLPDTRALYSRAAASLLPYLPLDRTPAEPPAYMRLDEPVVDLEAAQPVPPPLSAFSPPPVLVREGESPGFNPHVHEPYVVPNTNPSPGTMKMST